MCPSYACIAVRSHHHRCIIVATYHSNSKPFPNPTMDNAKPSSPYGVMFSRQYKADPEAIAEKEQQGNKRRRSKPKQSVQLCNNDTGV